MSKKPLKVIAGAPDRPLAIGNVEIPCYVLENETRVLSQAGVFTGVGAVRSGGGAQMPRFMASKSISPFISNELSAGLNFPIEFQPARGGRTAYGYPATLLIEMCDAALAAREAGALHQSQLHIAARAEILVRGCATVGIIALVDEATGYDKIKERRVLAEILEKYLERELHPWTKTFPYSFYDEICKLKRWPSWYAVKRPHKISEYTNDFIYARIAPGILKELRKRNPIEPETGERKVKHHQWFTEKIGHPKLKEHIAIVTALMKASPNWSRFKGNLQRVFPQKHDNFLLTFMDDD